MKKIFTMILIFVAISVFSIFGTPEEQRKTIASLKKVADGLYTMTYYGSFEENAANLLDYRVKVQCSTFTTGDGQTRMLGRNGDWGNVNTSIGYQERFTTALVFYNPPNKYASVFSVEITLMGWLPNEDGRQYRKIEKSGILKDLDTNNTDKTPLLDAPYFPFDGMNGMGLAIGATACYDPSMVDIKYTKAILKREPRDLAFPFLAIRESLDSAKNIGEAIKIFEKHDLYGSQMHFLVSDVSGRSVIIEYTDKGMLVYEGKPTQVMLTKPFYMYGDEANSKLDDNRNRGYNKALKTLPINNEEAMNVLKSGSQPKSSKGAYTQWSVVYNQITGEISCTVFMDYKNIHKYQLNMKKY